MHALMITRLFAVVLAAAVIASHAPANAHDPAPIEREIRGLDAQWNASYAAKDLTAVVEVYAKDAIFMAPNAPALDGREAIAEAIQGMLGLPGLELRFEPNQFHIASRGDLAVDIGLYTLAFDGEQGRIQDEGKYVFVWRKVDGAWKVVAEMFNTNLPAQ